MYWIKVLAAVFRRQFTHPPHPPFPTRKASRDEE